ncbi:hypothetical protein [Streptomyces sp. NPDC101132]|uniref:hypothetical protein n=1 Tax=Streptomyces sp. NPDC101132 TaxID=3366110 RepID=UPI0037F36531
MDSSWAALHHSAGIMTSQITGRCSLGMDSHARDWCLVWRRRIPRDSIARHFAPAVFRSTRAAAARVGYERKQFIPSKSPLTTRAARTARSSAS